MPKGLMFFMIKGKLIIIALIYDILPSPYNANTMIFIKIYHPRINRGVLNEIPLISLGFINAMRS